MIRYEITKGQMSEFEQYVNRLQLDLILLLVNLSYEFWQTMNIYDFLDAR